MKRKLSVASDKLIERDRYDARAKELVVRDPAALLGPDGATAIPIELRTPYVYYEQLILSRVTPGASLLDVCCGNGLHSIVGARAGAIVTAVDFAENGIVLARLRAARAGVVLHTVVADAEHLPFKNETFDFVTCAGSLSYVDLDVFVSEVSRVLKDGGWFICIDSLNHNPIYRFNRYVHFRRGKRSLSVIQRTPVMTTIETLGRIFPRDNCVRFFGVCAFLAPLLRWTVGSRNAAWLLDRIDYFLLPYLRRFGFKFVFAGMKSRMMAPSSSMV